MTKVRTISATCPCGASFDREVKRGRPQKWCPACLVIPFYERVGEAPVAEGEAPASKPAVGTSFDRLAHVRSEVEADVAVVNADHKVRFAALVKSGLSNSEAAAIAGQESADKMRAIYAKWSGKAVVETIVEDEEE